MDSSLSSADTKIPFHTELGSSCGVDMIMIPIIDNHECDNERQNTEKGKVRKGIRHGGKKRVKNKNKSTQEHEQETKRQKRKKKERKKSCS